MKLLFKTSIFTTTVTVLLFIIGAFIIYKTILIKLDSEVTENLLSAKEHVITGLKNGINFKEFNSNIGQKINVKEIDKTTFKGNKIEEKKSKEFFEEEEEIEDEEIIERKLISQTCINNKCYEISISSSLSEEREIGEYVLNVVIVFLALSVIILFIVKSIISKYIWSPFYKTLDFLTSWKIDKKQPFEFKKNSVNEFNLLNATVCKLTTQIRDDYVHLKEFTENVSHETQTPLSIISSKL